MSKNIKIIKELYHHFASKDNEAIRKIFAKNIIWMQMKGFPNGGRYIGPYEVFNNVFQGFRDNWIEWKTVIEEYLESGDSVLAVGRYEGTYNTTNKFVKAEFIHRYQLQEGKVSKFTQYTDTLLIHEAMQR